MRSFGILASLFAAASADGVVRPFFLRSASDIASIDDLEHWKTGAQADISKLPQDRQSLMLMSLEREYKQRLAQIGASDASETKSELPSFLVLESAHRYHTMEELRSWRERQIDEIKKNVPLEYQHYGYDSVQKEFETRKATLEQQQEAPVEPSVTSLAAMDLPVLKLNAEEFTSSKELDAWRSEQLDQIQQFVPKGYRGFATETVEAEYRIRAKQLAAEAAAEPQVQPLFLRSASDLGTEAELRAWLVEEQQHIHEEVPEGQQQFLLDSVQQEYEQRLQQLAGQGGAELPALLVLESAHRYHTLTELESWRARQVDRIKRDVPFEYQQVGLDSVEREYLKRKGQLERSSEVTEVPVEQALMLTAEEFQSKAQLDEWRAQQEATIDKYVPENYRKYAVQSIDREYQKRVAALETNSTAVTESSGVVETDSNTEPVELPQERSRGAESELAEKDEDEQQDALLDEEQLVEAKMPFRVHAGNVVLAVSAMFPPTALFVAAVVAGLRRRRREGADEPLLAQPEDHA